MCGKEVKQITAAPAENLYLRSFCSKFPLRAKINLEDVLFNLFH